MRVPIMRRYCIFISGLVIQFVSVGIGYGYSVMFAELLSVFNTSRFEASFVQGIYFCMTFSGGILWSWIIHKLGTGPATIVGILLSAAGLVGCSLATNIAEIIAFAGVANGVGMSVCYLSTFISVSDAFRKDPRVHLTALTIGASLGHFASPMIFEIIIAKYFWSGAFVIIAGFVLQCLPFALILLLRSEFNDKDKQEEKSKPQVCDVKVIKDGILCSLLINTLLLFMTGNIEALFIVDQLIDRHYDRNKGSMVMSVTGLASVLGRTLASLIVFKCKKWPALNHLIYTCVLLAIGHALVLQFINFYTVLMLASILRGTSFGIINALVPTVIYEASGYDKYPAAMAFANVSIGLGDFLSCILGGIVRDEFGDYNKVYYVSMGTAGYVTISSIIIACKIRRNNERKNCELINGIVSKTDYETMK